MSFLYALSFLTIVPFPSKQNESALELGRSTVFFPLAGLLIGLLLAGFSYLLRLILPGAVVNGLVIALLAVITGGLHLDGVDPRRAWHSKINRCQT